MTDPTKLFGTPDGSGTFAGAMLRETANLVEGDRAASHGNKLTSFSVIAAFWNNYLLGRKNPSAPIGAADVTNMMVLLKIARAIQGSPIRDHFADMAGYAAITGEIVAMEQAMREAQAKRAAEVASSHPAAPAVSVQD